MYQDSKRTCRTIVLLIKPFVCCPSRRRRRRRRGLLKLPYGRPGAVLFKSLSQASQYATLLPAVYPSTSSFCSNTEHLFQVGNSHLKHLYLVLMKQKRHISITLCDDVKSDFRSVRPFPALSSPDTASFWSAPKGARPLGPRMYSRSRNCTCTAHMIIRGKKRSVDAGVCIFVAFAQSITFESIIL